MQLRPYQLSVIEALRDAIRKYPGQPGLLVAPTGSGKSEMAGHIARSAVDKGNRVGFVVNRRILVRDLSRRVDRLGMEYGVIMGSSPRKPWAKVHVASFDTLYRRPIPKWSLAFIDEAHVSMAATYSAVIKKMQENGTVIIGMTATPIRGTSGLGGTYKWMVRCPDTPELIDMGFLVRPRVFAPSAPDLKGVSTTAGDYNQRELAQAVDRSALTGDILKHWLPYRGRPTIGFGVDINHCKHMAETFQAAGVRAVAVDHKYKGDLDLVWKQLASYEIEVVFNVGIAGYGFDCPPVSCMIEGRPTKSLALWLQHCGRVMRIHETKQDCVIFDHAANCMAHGLPDEPRDWTLDENPEKFVKKAPPVTTCKTPVKHPDGTVQLPCYATFRSGPTECPYCGIMLVKKKADIKVREGELVEIGSVERPVRYDMMNTYLEYLKIQRERGYKSGYAKMQFFSRFRRWPEKAVIAAAELALEMEESAV